MRFKRDKRMATSSHVPFGGMQFNHSGRFLFVACCDPRFCFGINTLKFFSFGVYSCTGSVFVGVSCFPMVSNGDGSLIWGFTLRQTFPAKRALPISGRIWDVMRSNHWMRLEFHSFVRISLFVTRMSGFEMVQSSPVEHFSINACDYGGAQATYPA